MNIQFSFSGLVSIFRFDNIVSPIMPSLCSPILLSMMRGILFFLVGISFLIFTAWGGGARADNSAGIDTPGGDVRGLNCLAEANQDCDGDGYKNNVDVDDDGDGLIEIATAAELDAVRYALRGDGRRLSEGGKLDTAGCGGDGGITFCSGYELITDISLVDYTNWQPLGHDTNGLKTGCQGASFSGTFEGNGFGISDLIINRPNEDCVGLFGSIAKYSEIRNLRLSTEAVIGKNFVGGLMGGGDELARIHSFSVVAGEVSAMGDAVGGLVGWGESIQIHSSSVVVGEVSGAGDAVGGLVGYGKLAQIVSSSVVAGEVSGTGDSVGGLVGWGGLTQIVSSSVVVGELRGTGKSVGGLAGQGKEARIYSSSAVADEVSGNSRVGGLVGQGEEAWVYSSSAVADEVSGTDDVGGLVGDGPKSRIHSSSVVVGEVRGSSRVGGLVGHFSFGRVAYSYVISGSNTAMLVGYSRMTGIAFYWDSETSGKSSDKLGEAKASDALRSPTDYEGIYTSWSDWTDIFNGGDDEPLAVWCDKNNSKRIEPDERTDSNFVWDFGTSSEYPAIRCSPLNPAEWRSWWSLDKGGKPRLNQARLNKLLPASN